MAESEYHAPMSWICKCDLCGAELISIKACKHHIQEAHAIKKRAKKHIELIAKTDGDVRYEAMK